MADSQDYSEWTGREVVDPSGEKVGRLEEVYLAADTGQPQWAAIKTGLLGTKLSLAPLAGASWSDSGDLSIAVDKRAVSDAPSVDAGRGVSPDDEAELQRHYGVGSAEQAQHGEAAGRSEQPTVRHEEPAAPAGGDAVERGDAAPAGHAAEHERREEGVGGERRPEEPRGGEGRVEEPEGGAASTEQESEGGTRIRRRVVTEHLSESGEVIRRETQIEEDRPGPDAG